MKLSRSCFLCMLCLFGISCLARAYVWAGDCQKISLHYNERIPYLKTEPNGVSGITGSPAQLAFEKAGVGFEWKNTPSKRQLVEIQENKGCDCAVGWFKNPEREKFAKFTEYIYQDKPYIALAMADNSMIQSGNSVDSLLSNKDLTLAVKEGYSYGSFLDKKIAEHNPKVDSSVGENDVMLKKLSMKRVSYFFIAPEEADGLVAASGLPKESFKYITFSDMPAGEKRYILCSQQVDDKIIEKLNDAITKNVKR